MAAAGCLLECPHCKINVNVETASRGPTKSTYTFLNSSLKMGGTKEVYMRFGKSHGFTLKYTDAFLRNGSVPGFSNLS